MLVHSVGKTWFVSHTKHTQRKNNGFTSFTIDNMYYVNFRIYEQESVPRYGEFKTKNQKYLGTLLIFTLISLVLKKCGLSINLYVCVQGRIRECPTLTYKSLHSLTKFYITDYLIGLAFWTIPIGLQCVAWSGTKREQIKLQLQWALGFSVNS